MLIEEDVYLDHYGKKGMHWGVRTAQKVSAPAVKVGGKVGKAIKRQTAPDKKERNKKIAIGIGTAAGAAAIAAGAIYARKHMHTSIKELPSSPNISPKTIVSAPHIYKINDDKGISDYLHSRVANSHSSEHEKFIAAFSARQAIINKEANADLRKRYEANMVPIHQREYLSDWAA